MCDEYEPEGLYTIEMDNGLTVQILENDHEILDDLIPLYEVTVSLDGNPLRDPETMRPMIPIAALDNKQLRAVLQFFSEFDVGKPEPRLKLVH